MLTPSLLMEFDCWRIIATALQVTYFSIKLTLLLAPHFTFKWRPYKKSCVLYYGVFIWKEMQHSCFYLLAVLIMRDKVSKLSVNFCCSHSLHIARNYKYFQNTLWIPVIFVKRTGWLKLHRMQCNASVPTTQYLKKSMLFGIQCNVSEHSSAMQFSSTMISYIIRKKNHYKLKK